MLDFKFPDVGEGITEGQIVKWRVKEGDSVKQDQVLVEIETDKAVVEIPSPQPGTILKIHVADGENINVGQVIVTIGEKGEKISVTKKVVEKIKDVAKKPEKQPEKYTSSVVGKLDDKIRELPPVTQEIKTVSSTGVKALPKVRKLAEKLGVDLKNIEGTGSGGKITEDDVNKHAGAAGITPVKHPAAPNLAAPKMSFNKYGRVLEIPISGIKKKIAENMTRSRYTAPHATEMEEADVTKLVQFRKKNKKLAEDKGVHLTYLPFVVKAVVAALEKHPYVNASMDDERNVIINKQYYNIGIATDTPFGLMVPVVKNADKKSIIRIAHDIETMADAARERKIDIKDLQGGTFTITNYGSLGGTFGVPIINYPEAAILGVGRIMEKPVVKDGEIIIRKIMPLSLSFDHRIIDGAQAARFIRSVMNHLEDPDYMLLDIGSLVE